MKRAIALTALFASVLSTTPAGSQATVASGIENSKYSQWVNAKTTVPRIGVCEKRESKCFRILVELTPVIDGEVGISLSNDKLSAYTGAGAQCEGYLTGGLNRFGAFDRYRDKWDVSRLTFANRNKPAVAIFNVECDGNLISGDEITYQISFDYYIDARTFGKARYIFRQIRAK